MSITYSSRNIPQQTQGTVEPIKVTANTHGQPRSQVGMTPRLPVTNSIATEANPLPVAPEATPAQTGQEDQISSKFAALARKERQLRQQTAEFQAKQAELIKYQEEATQAKAYRERLKSHPLDVLNEEGITYDQLVQRAVNMQNANPEVTALQKQVSALEESLKRQSEESQSAIKAQREQAEKQISMDVKSLISSDSAYETVKDMGAEEAVTQLITATYDEEGILLKVDEAAKQVEEYLIAEATRIANVPSIKKRLAPKPEEAMQQQAVKPAPQTGIKTLSHAMASTSETPARTWAQKKAQVVAKWQKK